MQLPGFSADASLGTSSEIYRARTTLRVAGSNRVAAQGCDLGTSIACAGALAACAAVCIGSLGTACVACLAGLGSSNCISCLQ